MANKPFKMKGSPMKRNFGIGAESSIKQTTPPPSYSGINIDPMSSYGYKDSPNIPKFRDMVTLEQQQAYAKKVDERRAKRKETKEWKKKKQAGAYTLDKEDIDLEEKEAPEATTEISGGKGEVRPENETNIGSNTGSYVTEEKPNPYLLQ